jgi:peroxiredoxin
MNIQYIEDNQGKLTGVFVPIEDWEEISKKAGIEDDETPELPLAATYIIGKDGIIKWAYLNPDYRNRAEPDDIIAALKSL